MSEPTFNIKTSKTRSSASHGATLRWGSSRAYAEAPYWKRKEQQVSDEQGYIAGPMTGYPEHNYPAFDRALEIAQERFPSINWISPAQMDRDAGYDANSPNSYPEAMRRDLAVILDPRTTTILLLPAWEYSQGAFAETITGGIVGLSFYEIGCLKAADIWPLTGDEVKARLLGANCGR